MSPKHRRPVVIDIPEWLDKLGRKDTCLRSVAEDAYLAKALAVAYGAAEDESCAQVMRAGEKSLRTLEDEKADSKLRCAAGDRAARKFWEAKVCARAR